MISLPGIYFIDVKIKTIETEILLVGFETLEWDKNYPL